MKVEKTDKALYFGIETHCSECGHVGKLYLDGELLKRWKDANFRHFMKHQGWRLFLGYAGLGAILGFALGWWRP